MMVNGLSNRRFGRQAVQMCAHNNDDNDFTIRHGSRSRSSGSATEDRPEIFDDWMAKQVNTDTTTSDSTKGIDALIRDIGRKRTKSQEKRERNAKIVEHFNIVRDETIRENHSDVDKLDFSKVLDNSCGGVTELPLSIPITEDDEGNTQPMFEPVVYDENGEARPVTKDNIDQYLYGAKLMTSQLSKMIKLYGSGNLN